MCSLFLLGWLQMKTHPPRQLIQLLFRPRWQGLSLSTSFCAKLSRCRWHLTLKGSDGTQPKHAETTSGQKDMVQKTVKAIGTINSLVTPTDHSLSWTDCDILKNSVETLLDADLLVCDFSASL